MDADCETGYAKETSEGEKVLHVQNPKKNGGIHYTLEQGKTGQRNWLEKFVLNVFALAKQIGF